MDMDTDERAELDILGGAMAEARELLAEARAELEAARAREGALRSELEHLADRGTDLGWPAEETARADALLAAPAPPPSALLALVGDLHKAATEERGADPAEVEEQLRAAIGLPASEVSDAD